MEKYIKDFEKSDAPQFKGKSKDKRIQMAVAAKLQSMGKKMEEGSNMEEAIDVNDPALVKARAAAHQRTLPKPEIPKPVKTINPAWKAAKNADKIRALKKQRAQLMIDMEQEAEPEGGPIANRYGRELNKIDKAIAMLSEAKATYCGRCKHTHVKGTQCPTSTKEGAEMTSKYDDAEQLKGGQKKLPDMLQKAIVDKVVGKIKEIVVTDNADEAEVITKTGQEVKLVPKGSIKEGMHADYEGKMAKAQLISIVKNAKDLFDSMDDNTQLKAWIQSKLSKAEDYISSVRTYLDGESLTTTTPLIHNGEPVRDDEGSALNIGDVVKAADGKIYQVVFSYSEGKPFLTPFDLKRRKPVNLRERHYFDNVSEEMNKTLKMSKVMEYTATKGGFMR
jgi:RNase P subunit RPR2